MSVLVRYYAGAAEAAGVDEERVELGSGRPLAELLDLLTQRHGQRLGTVLPACSFLLDATSAGREAPVGADATVDVLPPFAGG
ncbi:molybdopterin converting factor small subunit [Kineococcus xinjiangensis]|uniref:Molybdopterin converting factor small subunit n=1 Tax=Kineococcus xinjiangensis TaxID=512762 RepID=A0A2S6IG86_9ACTN|nr:MoaD/ThiS family protein [Kineococcus xinjiangensis]PPK93206.1 molybdopterin converting factor small subunit [Kineococcus xinjiangensis]